MSFENILSKVFPNIQIYSNKNQLTFKIPKEDIINIIMSKINPELKENISIDFYPDGILIEINNLEKLFAGLKQFSSNFRVEPNTLRVFIPKDDIINNFKYKFPNANIDYNESGILISLVI